MTPPASPTTDELGETWSRRPSEAVHVLGTTSPPGEGLGSLRNPELLLSARQAESLSSTAPAGDTLLSIQRRCEMERVYERCAAPDVHKEQVTVCAHVPDQAGPR